MRIESIGIHNYKSLQNVKLSKIQGLTVFVGRNGAGKTAFFDVFRFLNDALRDNVKIACGRRGGFKQIRSRG